MLAAAVAAAFFVLFAFAFVVPAAGSHRTSCDRVCVERVAMHQCSNARPVPCIRRAAMHQRVSFDLQLAIARCESGLRPWVTNNGGSGSSGLMQFMPGTFAATPYGRHSIFSAKWSALAGAWLLRRAGTGPWTASQHCWA